MINIEDLANKGELFDGHYKLLRPLSTEGATADVWLAIDTNTIDAEYDETDSTVHSKEDETGMLVAIKIYRPKNALDIEGEQRFRDEFKIVYECRHENLLQPTSFAIYNDIPYLVLPYCKNGSSEQLIGKNQTEEEVWKFISDVASGLAKLHSNQPQIIHQDIKPANILIDNSHNYAITDFGISSKKNGMHSGYYDDENSGTFAYMAPERFSDDPTPIPESDIWAFGATLCEILTAKVPFGEEGGKNQKDNSSMPQLSGLPSSIRNLIQACLQKDMKRRPTARQIMKAAQVKKYPIKRNKPLYFIFVLLVCLLIVGAVVYFHKSDEFPEYQQRTAGEVFDEALKQMNSDNIDMLDLGLHTMDSLSNQKYIPAMYEIAFTYGWYSDSASIQRKKMLGIEMDTNNYASSDKDVNKTKNLITEILAIEDSSYADYKASVAYLMAAYYGDKTINHQKIFYDKTLEYLEISKKWAEISKDTSLLETIKFNIHDLERQKNRIIIKSDTTLNVNKQQVKFL